MARNAAASGAHLVVCVRVYLHSVGVVFAAAVQTPTHATPPGGPGCSTALTAFYETGPYRIDDDDLSVTMADYSWDVNHNIIYLDQPIGTGFSYSTVGGLVPGVCVGVRWG